MARPECSARDRCRSLRHPAAGSDSMRTGSNARSSRPRSRAAPAWRTDETAAATHVRSSPRSKHTSQDTTSIHPGNRGCTAWQLHPSRARPVRRTIRSFELRRPRHPDVGSDKGRGLRAIFLLSGVADRGADLSVIAHCADSDPTPHGPIEDDKLADAMSQHLAGKVERLCSSFQTYELGDGPRTRFLVNFAGLPAWISNAGMSLVTTLPAAATACSPRVTPGQTTACAPTHDPSRSTIGLTISLNAGSLQSWLPVQRYAPCDTQQFDPIEISLTSSSHALSPIQECSPICKRHGNFTRVPGLMTTPWPMRAPNSRSIPTRQREPGSQVLKSKA